MTKIDRPAGNKSGPLFCPLAPPLAPPQTKTWAPDLNANERSQRRPAGQQRRKRKWRPTRGRP